MFPPPKAAVNPLTGAEKTGPGTVFERYDPDMKKAKKTHDIIYKKEYNKAASSFPFKPNQNTKYDNMMGYTKLRSQNPNPNAVQRFPRPQLGSLGAVRPPDA